MQDSLLIAPQPKSRKLVVGLAIAGVIALVGVIAFAKTTAAYSQELVSLPLVEPYIRQLFTNWERKYRSYSSVEERTLRLLIFRDNVKKIKAMMDAGSKTVGLNQFADMTKEEYKSTLVKIQFLNKTSNIETCENVGANPASIDWRTENVINPVRQQGSGANSIYVAAAESIEASMALKEQILDVFSDQQLQDCDPAANPSFDSAFTYTEGKGIETIGDYPDAGGKGTCKYDKSKVVFVPSAHFDVTPNSEKDLETTVARYPTAAYLDASSDSFQYYTSGVIDASSCGTTVDHAALIVGYNNTASPAYWIVKNSWGTSWGEQGYVRIAKGTAAGPGACGIATAPAYPIKRC